MPALNVDVCIDVCFFGINSNKAEVRDALQNLQNSLNSNIQITCVTLSILTLSYNFITNKKLTKLSLLYLFNNAAINKM